MPQSSPNTAATASDMDKNSGSSSSSASSGSSKGQQPPRSASAGPAGESKPKSGKDGLPGRWARGGEGEWLPLRLGGSLPRCLLGHTWNKLCFLLWFLLFSLFPWLLLKLTTSSVPHGFTCIFALVLVTAHEVGAILISILQMRKLRFREVRLST